MGRPSLYLQPGRIKQTLLLNNKGNVHRMDGCKCMKGEQTLLYYLLSIRIGCEVVANRPQRWKSRRGSVFVYFRYSSRGQPTNTARKVV